MCQQNGSGSMAAGKGGGCQPGGGNTLLQRSMQGSTPDGACPTNVASTLRTWVGMAKGMGRGICAGSILVADAEVGDGIMPGIGGRGCMPAAAPGDGGMPGCCGCCMPSCGSMPGIGGCAMPGCCGGGTMPRMPGGWSGGPLGRGIPPIGGMGGRRPAGQDSAGSNLGGFQQIRARNGAKHCSMQLQVNAMNPLAPLLTRLLLHHWLPRQAAKAANWRLRGAALGGARRRHLQRKRWRCAVRLLLRRHIRLARGAVPRHAGTWWCCCWHNRWLGLEHATRPWRAQATRAANWHARRVLPMWCCWRWRSRHAGAHGGWPRHPRTWHPCQPRHARPHPWRRCCCCCC